MNKEVKKKRKINDEISMEALDKYFDTQVITGIGNLINFHFIEQRIFVYVCYVCVQHMKEREEENRQERRYQSYNRYRKINRINKSQKVDKNVERDVSKLQII